MPSYAALPKFPSVVLSRYHRLPTILHLELNDQKTFNSLSPTMFDSWTRAVQWCAHEPTVHAVVVSGRGRPATPDHKRVFCSGMHMTKDVQNALLSDDVGAAGVPISMGRQAVAPARRFIDELIEFPKLLVAAVNGHAFGMGVTALPFHDLVFTLPKTTFKTPFAELGVCAEGCSSVLFPEILGPALTSRMLYGSEVIPAEELLPSGFVSYILSDGTTADELPQRALAHVADMLGVPEDLATEGHAGATAEDPFKGQESVTTDQYTNLSLDSIHRSKALRWSKHTKAYLHEVNDRECEQVAQTVASPEFKAGLGRFLAKQMKKKMAAAEAKAKAGSSSSSGARGEAQVSAKSKL